jgi:hypothetical protein
MEKTTPHLGQNFASALHSCPHLRQGLVATASCTILAIISLPQLAQNLAPSLLSAEQCGHFMINLLE